MNYIDENIKIKCKNCGKETQSTEYYNEQGWMLEQHYECKNCGFKRHWVCGQVMIEDSEYKEN